MLEYAVIIGVILGSGYWIINPLLKPRLFDETINPKADEMLRELEFKKEGAYAAIRELEFDTYLGKLSKEDYEVLKQQYMREAVNSLKRIDELQMPKSKPKNMPEAEIENTIEEDILTLRKHKSAPNADAFCTQCGVKISCRDRYCFACGTKLTIPDLALTQ